MKKTATNKTYILCFLISKYERDMLKTLYDEELLDLAINDPDHTIRYGQLEDFLEDMNDQRIEADKYWFFQATIEEGQKYTVSFSMDSLMTGRKQYMVVLPTKRKQEEIAMDAISLASVKYVKKGKLKSEKECRDRIMLTEEDYRKMFCK